MPTPFQLFARVGLLMTMSSLTSCELCVGLFMMTPSARVAFAANLPAEKLKDAINPSKEGELVCVRGVVSNMDPEWIYLENTIRIGNRNKEFFHDLKVGQEIAARGFLKKLRSPKNGITHELRRGYYNPFDTEAKLHGKAVSHSESRL